LMKPVLCHPEIQQQSDIHHESHMPMLAIPSLSFRFARQLVMPFCHFMLINVFASLGPHQENHFSLQSSFPRFFCFCSKATCLSLTRPVPISQLRVSPQAEMCMMSDSALMSGTKDLHVTFSFQAHVRNKQYT